MFQRRCPLADELNRHGVPKDLINGHQLRCRKIKQNPTRITDLRQRMVCVAEKNYASLFQIPKISIYYTYEDDRTPPYGD